MSHPKKDQAVSVAAASTGWRSLAPVTKARLLFLTASGASLALSVALWFSGQKDQGLFVGLWAPTVLAAGALMTSGGTHE
jgi:hypothetical protein